MDWVMTTKLFAALFAILNPLSVIPVYLALTADQTAEVRRQSVLAMIATVVAGALVCAVAGQAVLSLFGIDVAHFRLAGGLIVLLIALSMLSGEDHSSHSGTADEKTDFHSTASVGIYPLAIPIALGPGTMATIIVFAQSASVSGAHIGYYVGLIGYLAFFSAMLAMAPLVANWMSPIALSVSKRIMGIILAAIAFEMIAGALLQIFPAWAEARPGL